MRAGADLPFIAVVMRFGDSVDFIDEAIASVRDQTYDRWELLLLDDGSADGSASIAAAHAEADPHRIRLLEHPAGPVLHALTQATGELVMMLGADDVWLPSTLWRAVDLMTHNPSAEMAMAPTILWRSWSEGGSVLDDHVDFDGRTGVPGLGLVAAPRVLEHFLDRPATIPCAGGVVIRRAAIDVLGGAEDPTDPTDPAERPVLMAKLAARHPVFVDGEIWGYHRQPEGSAVGGRGATAPYLSWLQDHLRSTGVTDRGVWRAHRRAVARTRSGAMARIVARSWRNAPRAVARRAHDRVPKRVEALAQVGLHGKPYVPPVGTVRFGSLRRTTPISLEFGFDRGTPIDRLYIEGFLARHAGGIRGRVLEVGDDAYTRRFGGREVTKRDVLHIHRGNPRATLVDDLTEGASLPSDAFDCLVLTQTLHLVYDFHAAVRTMHRILRPGGTALVTVPGITQSYDEWADTWFWAFNTQSMTRVFGDVFGAEQIEVEGYGNILAATAFLQGLAAEELASDELRLQDPAYEVTIGVAATKAG